MSVLLWPAHRPSTYRDRIDHARHTTEEYCTAPTPSLKIGAFAYDLQAVPDGSAGFESAGSGVGDRS
jgi:hypothetical protein